MAVPRRRSPWDGDNRFDISHKEFYVDEINVMKW
jgi:hypothetical protein